MVFCFARQRNGMPTLEDVEHAVRRNFSGLDELDPWEDFRVMLEVWYSLIHKENFMWLKQFGSISQPYFADLPKTKLPLKDFLMISCIK